MSRTKKTVRNSVTGIIINLISALVSFVLQSVFIRLLGLEYSGINNLFTEVLRVLNLAELGFSGAVLYRLYKAIAEKDKVMIATYLSAYRKICFAVAGIVLLGGLCCIPFLDKLVTGGENIKEPLWTLFIVVISTSALTQYIHTYKIYIVANQDRYITSLVDYGCTLLCHFLQIVVLFLFKNIYLYLLVKFGTILLNGIIVMVISKKKYSIDTSCAQRLSKSDVKMLTGDVAALTVYRICRTIDAGLDTFLIGKFINIAIVGIYGSVMMIINMLTDLLGQFNEGMLASIGNLNAVDSSKKEQVFKVFKQSYHFAFMVYGVCAIILCGILDSFMVWWIGHTLEKTTIFLIIFNFVVAGFDSNLSVYRNSMGLYKIGWVRPIFTALINLVASIILINYMGINGVFVGTIIARGCTLFLFEPYIILHRGMNQKTGWYYLRYFIYMIIIGVGCVITYFISTWLPVADTFIELIYSGVIYLVVALVVVCICGMLFKEQKDLFKRILQVFKRSK